jgi:hypothetical protein
MAKVKPVDEKVYNQELGGVRVTIQLYSPLPNEEVMISLPGPSAWQGKLLPSVQRLLTDNDGCIVIMLPPSEEIKALTPRNPVPGLYKLTCAFVGTLTFEVPNVPEWTLGT